MTIQKIKSGRVTGVDVATYIGNHGQIFYNEAVGELRLSNGVTPGGIVVSSSGSGGASNITLDGGLANSVYGGLEIIDGGGV